MVPNYKGWHSVYLNPLAALLLVVLEALSFALGVGGGGAAGCGADPNRTVLPAEPGLVANIALAVWHWADPIRTVLLAEIALDSGCSATAWKDAQSVATVLAAESQQPTSCVDGATQCTAHTRCTPTVLEAEASCVRFGGAARMHAHSLVTPTVLGTETSCVCFGGAAWMHARSRLTPTVLDAELSSWAWVYSPDARVLLHPPCLKQSHVIVVPRSPFRSDGLFPRTAALGGTR
jgi:hypothetical protein